ncbi:hypothetical protein UF64_10350 [Thalassospira sp. HJ]|uniref:hypothetical protein n=1 Tax=Thalassospira sp. HJ TaxID=1616823 RepID=UPI0005CE466C|nr:hypothetical protein [Thalassospira sp. HJ]KJE35083.1 hypothetical protein UF64_10350 [Thalassospira sp. HJ]
MTFVDWAQIISAGAAAVAAGVSAYSVRLVLKQLKYQFSPNLRIADEVFQIAMHESALKDIFWEQPSEAAKYLNGGSTEYQFHMRNTGAGSAHDLSIETVLDLEEIYRQIHEIFENIGERLEVIQDNWGAQIKANGKTVGGFRNPNQSSAYIDYIKPSTDDLVTVPFIIDPTLAFACLALGYRAMKQKIDEDVTPTASTINVSFLISYTDPIGKKLTKRCEHQISVCDGRWADDLSDGVIVISFRKR